MDLAYVYLYAFNKEDKRYYNISPRNHFGKLMPLWMTTTEKQEWFLSQYSNFMDDNPSTDEYVMTLKAEGHLHWLEMDYKLLKHLGQKFKFKIHYLSVDSPDNKYIKYTENLLIEKRESLSPLEYAQLSQEEKQKYIPVVFRDTFSEEYFYSELYRAIEQYITISLDYDYHNIMHSTFDFTDLKIITEVVRI